MAALFCVILASACTQTIPAAPSPTTPAAVTASSPPATLTVMAAASLTEAFSALGQQFEAQNPGVKVEFSFAGSQQLAQQLASGAPADVFASASQKYIDSVVQSGRVDQNAAAIFTRNRLVVIFPKDNPAGLRSLKDLARPGLKLALAAREVPVGQYSLDFLDRASGDPGFSPSYKDDVLKNVVSYEENVKSVLTKVALGEADAGIVYTSDVSGDAAAKVGQITIPDALNVIATYPIVLIKDSAHPLQAQAFIDLILSPAGQKVLAQYGFIPAIPP
jgi:molybdate transport system substrate-binding protein